MTQTIIDPRAVAAGLLTPQSALSEEPCLTAAGMVAVLGALAHDANTEPKVREKHQEALSRLLVAASNCGLDGQAEGCLRQLFAAGVDPISPDDQGQLLAVLCRLVALLVGAGRIGALIAGDCVHELWIAHQNDSRRLQ